MLHFHGDKKENQEYKDELETNRNQMKTHIMNYGSLFSHISSPGSEDCKKNSNGVYVMCAPKLQAPSHAVSIIGWDDNFKASNFPSELGVTQDGAWLVLNSWGTNFGNNGCFWVSYQDYYIEECCRGIIEVSDGKVDVKNADISIQARNYNGKEVEPPVTFYYNDNIYQQNVDYTVEYFDNINAGNGKAIITGIGRFTGTVEKEFTIRSKKLKETNTTINTSEFIYDGTEKKPEVIVKNGDIILQKDVDYTLTYSNNINSGTGTVTINGIGNYTGEIVKEFTILKKELSPDDVTLNESELVYDGTEKMPDVIVKNGDVALQKDIDYTLTYYNNINPGKATVIINGIGNYSGEIVKEFTISKKELSHADVTLNESELVYDGNEKKPDVIVKNGDITLQKNVDYTLEYSNNINVGTATIIITGINNCSGQVNLTFTINKGNPQYNIPTGLTTVFGKTLADVKLPEGFSWQDKLSTTVGNVGNNIFKCTFTPPDQENYNTISDINVVITVIAKIELNTDNYLVETFKDKNQQQILYIENIKQGTTLKAFFDNINVNGETFIYDKKGQEISDNTEIVKTGMKLKASTEFETIEYVLVVKGDLTGDGMVNISDLLKLARYLAKLDLNLDGAYYLGANVYRNPNNVFKVDISDLLKFARVLAKLDEFYN